MVLKAVKIVQNEDNLENSYGQAESKEMKW